MLQDYAIQRNSTLDLVIHWPGSVQIFAETLTGKRIPLDVELTDRIEDVKDQIWEKAGFRRDHQRLIFDDKEPENGKMLQDYPIQKDSTLHVDLGPSVPTQIFIKTPAGRNIPLDVQSTDRIEDVKARIQDMEGLLPECQRLFFDVRELEDGNTLQDYFIPKDSTIDLFVRWPGSIHIFAKLLTGKQYSLEVDPLDRIGYLKGQIWEMEGLEPRWQRLIFAGQHLEDDFTIEDCHICDKSTLRLLLRIMG